MLSGSLFNALSISWLGLAALGGNKELTLQAPGSTASRVANSWSFKNGIRVGLGGNDVPLIFHPLVTEFFDGEGRVKFNDISSFRSENVVNEVEHCLSSIRLLQDMYFFVAK